MLDDAKIGPELIENLGEGLRNLSTNANKLSEISDVIFKKSAIAGFMFGLSNLLMFMTFGLTFFLSVIYVSKSNIDINDSLTAVFLIIFASISAGNKANNLNDLMHLSEALKWLF